MLALLVPAVAASAADVEPAHANAVVAPAAGGDAAIVVVPGSIGGGRYVPAVNDYFHPDTFRSRATAADAGAVVGTTPAGESVAAAPAIAQRPAVLPLPTGLALGAAGLGTLAGLRAGRRVIAMSRR
jgi:hypothetical protein